jgi:hypothetical protein
MPRALHTRSGGHKQRVGARIGANFTLSAQIGQLRQRRRRRAEQLVDPVAVLLPALALEQLLVDPQCQRRVRVPDLLLQVGRVASGRQEQADVGAPKSVRRAFDDLRNAALAEQLVGLGGNLGDDTLNPLLGRLMRSPEG